LGGTPIVYYGEEIGMEDLPKDKLTFEECQDTHGKKYGENEYSKYSRDYERTPMQWAPSSNGEFSRNNNITPWLPLHPNVAQINVQVDKNFLNKNGLKWFSIFSFLKII
jgi:glycosidase